MMTSHKIVTDCVKIVAKTNKHKITNKATSGLDKTHNISLSGVLNSNHIQPSCQKTYLIGLSRRHWLSLGIATLVHCSTDKEVKIAMQQDRFLIWKKP